MATTKVVGPTIPTALYSKDKNSIIGQLNSPLVLGDSLGGNTVTIGTNGKFVGEFAAIDTATTPASGTCEVQFTLKDGSDTALAEVVSGIGYLSDDAGAMVTAQTGIAVATNGFLSEIVTGQVFQWIGKVDGTLGLTLTAAASYYISLVLPNGKIVVSDEVVVNA